LTVAVPDQADQREVRHVVLRVVLLHRRPEHRRGGEVPRRRQRLVSEHERQMVGQRARQRLARRCVDRSAEIDAGYLGAERGMQWRGLHDRPQRARPGVPAGTA